MLRHPLAIDADAYAAGYAKKSDRTLGLLLDSNVQVLRREDSYWTSVRESSVKYRLLMDELHGRAWVEEHERRAVLIARYAESSTAELEALAGKIQSLIGQCDRQAAVRWIYREKLNLVRAELRHRASGRDELPERDECGPEDDD